MDIYKKIIRLILFFIPLIILLLSYLWLVLHYSYTPNLVNSMKQVIDKKIEIAGSKKSPKIVIVGGSNSLVGTSAKKIEKELGVPTVNLSLYADLGDYILYESKRVIFPEDTVLLEMYYPFYWYKDKKAFERQKGKERMILTNDKKYFNRLNVIEKLNFAFIGLEDLIINIQDKASNQKNEWATTDEWGDNSGLNCPGGKSIILKDIQQIDDFPKDFTNEFYNYDGVKELDDFLNWCRQNKVKVLVSFPSINYLKNDKNKKFFSTILDFYQKKGIKILGKPDDYFYVDSGLFCEALHLNNKGRAFKTDQLVDSIKSIIGKK
jgi:hypothetical protein